MALVAIQMATAIASLFETKGLEAQEKAREAMEHFDEEWAKKRANIDYVPELHELAEACQFTSEFLPQIEEHWLCRFTDCRLFVRPEDWVHNRASGGGHYRCPSCCRQ